MMTFVETFVFFFNNFDKINDKCFFFKKLRKMKMKIKIKTKFMKTEKKMNKKNENEKLKYDEIVIFFVEFK